MKKRIHRSLVLLFCMIISSFVFPGQIVKGATGSCGYYTTALGVDSDARSDILFQFSEMGYTTSDRKWRNPSDLISGMKAHAVMIINGHGSQGKILCNDSSDNLIAYLFSNQANTSNGNQYLSSLSSTALNKEKLVIYLTCYSAANGTYNSMIKQTVLQGARSSIGFSNSVGRAEFWADYLSYGLKNGKTVQNAISYANTQYKSQNPTHAATSGSPTAGITFYGTNGTVL